MALAATLQDGFQDNVRNTALWNTGYFGGASAGSTVAESGQTVDVTLLGGVGGDQYNGFISVNTYDLTSSEFVVRLVTAPNTATDAEAVFAAAVDASNAYIFLITHGNIVARQRLAGINSALATTTYSPTTHAWLRIRESAAATIFDTATSSASNPPVGGDWTQMFSQTSAFAITAVKANIAGGVWNADASPGHAVWDGFNAATTSTVGDIAVATSGRLMLLGVG